MRKTITALALMLGVTSAINAQELPPNPEPGKCYVKCITKDEFKEEEVRIQVKPEYTVLKVEPAVYEEVTEEVLVKEASEELVYVPAVYETVEVPYVQKEKGNELEVVPAAFGEDSERIEILPKTAGWEYQLLEDCPSVNAEDCMTACFVEYPAEYKVVPQVTLEKDAHTNEKDIPEVPATYKKQVVKEPARMDKVEIPAEYATITKQVLVTPARTVEETIPAEYTTVTKKVLVKEGGMTVWEEVDCEYLTNTILPIYYNLDSASLTEDSKRVIDEMLLPQLLGKHTSVEIMSHTDSRGSASYNQALSQQRAQSVVDYLASKGIERARLKATGYGETRLVNRCADGVDCTDEEHRQNRRTEFRILGGN